MLEGSTYLTLPHVPYVVHTVVARLSVAAADESAFAQRARTTLLASIQRRLGKHCNDGTQPSVQAAILTPCYVREGATIGITGAMVDVFKAKSLEWLNFMFPPEHDDRPNVGLFANNVISQNQMLLNNALAVIERSATVLPDLSSDGFKAANAAMVAFWSRQDGRLQSLVRLIMSAPASSAAVEQVSSGAGRQNAPLRNRLRPSTLEDLTIVQRYITSRKMSNSDITSFIVNAQALGAAHAVAL